MTTETQPITLILNLGNSAQADEVNRSTTQLYNQLRYSKAEQVEKVRRRAIEAGAKGDPITLGTIALTVTPTVVAGVFMLINTWLTRRQPDNPTGNVTLKLADGTEVTIPIAMPEAERQALLDSIARQLKQISGGSEGV